MRFGTFLVALVLTAFSATAHAQVIRLDKGGYLLDYDCTNSTAIRYEYTLSFDNGSAARPSSFTLDASLPSGCAGQKTTSSYASVRSGYDRGHLVTSNHMDYNSTYIRTANQMSNIVPQVSGFNQGIWVQSENVAECYRDIRPVTVYGGVVYGDASNDYFVSSHGIKTPEYFWKTIVTTDPDTGATKAISWIIPNETGLGSLDDYLVTIADLEELLGSSHVGINVSSSVKNQLPSATWALPSGCDLS
ncbi:DNA/RNA non-specific endonuclease [Stenotrophomonas sp. MMGLT7]|uniref:DNA/RNA non-specific endonuclease n=1 Tax=Stenotrophomonas sp. MMGLT7 TaxID=2901227 RepID=UPI001E64DB30|nr:DNA/RNA non-specific endonuclease [Stenotrophomonas sp. MMGLT7]MCD7096925.1 DNA/RNA non-specific endonuclease [Stenotrophomonas sp. MMGLT7]